MNKKKLIVKDNLYINVTTKGRLNDFIKQKKMFFNRTDINNQNVDGDFY